MTQKRLASQLPTIALFFMICATIVTGLALVSRFHGFRIFDDAYMFLRYADHLLAGEGMVWNVGEGPVYGATSLAYVFSLIPFRLLFPDNGTAALFCSSFFWGMTFLVLIFRLALVVMKPSKSFKPFLAGFLFLGMVTAASTLKTHFSSGMETTMVMSYLAFALIQLEKLRQGEGSWIVTSLTLGIAWLVRPDLLIFSLGIPGLMFLLSPSHRKAWMKVTVATAVLSIGALLIAKLLTGSFLPMSFYAKSMKIYGPEFAAGYRWQGLGELVRFMARIWPALVLFGLGAFIRWPKLIGGKSALEKAILLLSLVFGIYYLGFVLQIMGFGQRFYYPLLPFIWYLALREIMQLPENLKAYQNLKIQSLPSNWRTAGTVVLAAILIYYSLDYADSLKKSLPNEPIAVFDAPSVYQKSYTDYWPNLLALQKVEGDFSMATTEVGMPAALFPDQVIYDLAGLNSAKLIEEGLNAKNILQYCRADLIFLPHTNYVRLNNDLQASKEFQNSYTQISNKALKAELGVAIRKSSPYHAALLNIYQQ